MEVLRTEQLCKWYGTDETEVRALSDIDLSIEKGEFVSVVGQSGSGKSTLLHLLGGVDRPSRGRVCIDGEDIYALRETELARLRRRKIGFVFQFYNLLPVLTAEENILLPLLMDNREPDTEFLEECISLLGLSDRRRHLPSELSGGQQQRVSIGRALIYRPSIILADEPTGNLDSRNRREIMDLLKLSARRYGQTLLLVTHDRDLACEADRVLTMEDGRIVQDRRIRG
jgi:putative ABC transport system ATP-binding protein